MVEKKALAQVHPLLCRLFVVFFVVRVQLRGERERGYSLSARADRLSHGIY